MFQESPLLSGAFGRRSRATFPEAESVELRVEKLLQTDSGLRLVSLTRVILKTVGEHQLHIGDEVTCCLIFTVVDPLSDGAQSNWLGNDIIVVRNLSL